MSAQITLLFILVGAYAGRTIRLGQYQFIKGACQVTAAPEEMALHARSLERNWQALPEGDPRIAEIEALIKGTNHEQREVQPAAPGPDGAPPVPGDGEPGGEGTAAGGEAGDGPGDGDNAAGGVEGGTESGDGQQASVTNTKLQKAIHSLDPKNDAHWTKDGKPAMQAVEAAYGSAAITRADVDAAAPDFVRPAVK